MLQEVSDTVCCGIYVLTAYKMVHSVAHLTQWRLEPPAPSRGIYIVSQRGVSQWGKCITRWSHGEKIWQNIDEAGASLRARLARGYDGGEFEKGRWLKGSGTVEYNAITEAPSLLPWEDSRPREQWGQRVSLMYRLIWSAAEHFMAAALVTEEEGTKSKWFKWNQWAFQESKWWCALIIAAW